MAFNFPDGASNGQTHTASNGTVYRYNGTTWVVDSASTTSNFDSRYLNTNGDGILSGSITDQLPSGVVSGSSQITDGSGILSGSITSQLPSGLVSSSAQTDRTWTLGASGTNHFTFTGPGLTGAENDPTLYLTRGETYKFIHPMGSHPFRIQSDPNGSPGTQYNDGVSSNDVTNGTITWDVQFDSPSKLYYQCASHNSMGGVFEILDKLPEGVVSGSAQITSVITDTYISSSAASSGFGSGGSSDFTTLTNVPSGLVSGSSQLTSSYDTRYLNVNGDGVVSGSVLRTLDGTGVVSGSVLRTLDGTGVVSGSVLRTLDGTGVVSGSSQLDGYVSSSTANIIQVMTSASYAAITPVSGTLYIIQG